jgi:hypothetical protein
MYWNFIAIDGVIKNQLAKFKLLTKGPHFNLLMLLTRRFIYNSNITAFILDICMLT